MALRNVSLGYSKEELLEGALVLDHGMRQESETGKVEDSNGEKWIICFGDDGLEQRHDELAWCWMRLRKTSFLSLLSQTGQAELARLLHLADLLRCRHWLYPMSR